MSDNTSVRKNVPTFAERKYFWAVHRDVLPPKPRPERDLLYWIEDAAEQGRAP